MVMNNYAMITNEELEKSIKEKLAEVKAMSQELAHRTDDYARKDFEKVQEAIKKFFEIHPNFYIRGQNSDGDDVAFHPDNQYQFTVEELEDYWDEF